MPSLTENINTLGSYTDPTIAAQKAAGTQLMAGQKAETAGLLGRYTGAIGGQETMSALAARLGQEQGLPTLRINSNRLNDTLRNIPSVVTNAARGNEVSQNQADRMISNQQQKISPFAQEATRQTQNAQDTVNTQMGYEQADQAKALMPYTMEQSLASERWARETTMFTTQNQNELDALMNKISSGVTLTEGEQTRANQLAIAEKGYQNALKIAEMDNSTKRYVADSTSEATKYAANPLGI
jgi:hypothetical protein